MRNYEDHPLRDVMPLGEAFGLGLRQIRIDAGLTLDKVATAATALGLKWSTARVVEFEKGKIPITLPTLVILGTVLTSLTGRGITMRDLLGWDRWLEMPGGAWIHAKALQDAFSGGAIDLRQGDDIERERDRETDLLVAMPELPAGLTAAQLRYMHEYAGLADERAAKKLGMSLDEFLAFSIPVFGISLSEYRDSRLPTFANAQERGQFTRRAVALVDDFSRRYKNGDQTAIERWNVVMSLWGSGLSPEPLADRDPAIRTKLNEARLELVERQLAKGNLDEAGVDLLGAKKIADEGWSLSIMSNDIINERFEQLVLNQIFDNENTFNG